MRASAFAAVTSGDNSNILCARIARETYEIPNVVARIYDPRRAEIFQRLGIPTVPTVAWTIDHVLRRMLPERAVTEWSDSTGRLHLIERTLPTDWEGRRLPAGALHGEGIRVVAVTRAGLPTLDVEELVGQEGDVLHLVVSHGAESKLAGAVPRGVHRAWVHGRREPPMKVAIAGAGNVGRFLAEDLAPTGMPSW